MLLFHYKLVTQIRKEYPLENIGFIELSVGDFCIRNSFYKSYKS